VTKHSCKTPAGHSTGVTDPADLHTTCTCTPMHTPRTHWRHQVPMQCTGVVARHTMACHSANAVRCQARQPAVATMLLQPTVMLRSIGCCRVTQHHTQQQNSLLSQASNPTCHPSTAQAKGQSLPSTLCRTLCNQLLVGCLPAKLVSSTGPEKEMQVMLTALIRLLLLKPKPPSHLLPGVQRT
jgi:hypothetical protein